MREANSCSVFVSRIANRSTFSSLQNASKIHKNCRFLGNFFTKLEPKAETYGTYPQKYT